MPELTARNQTSRPFAATAVDSTFIRIAKIETSAASQRLTNATGFFYLHDGFLYLVTARHVVVNDEDDHYPDALQVTVHSDAADLRITTQLSIPLYVNGVPQWYQHPRYGSRVDMVAVAVNDPHVLSGGFVEAFGAADIAAMDYAMPLGQDVLILGFPLGFQDTLHHLPLVRRAMIATAFSHPFQGEPCFLTDARLHRGMSGAPVIAWLPNPMVRTADRREPSWRLLGIHSAAWDVSNRDPDQDDRLALNTAWYAALIPEMLPSRGTASPGRAAVSRVTPVNDSVLEFR